MEDLPTLKTYEHHLEKTADWLLRSIRKGRGGSCAHYTPLVGWSRPYPETTGYLIPTLLRLEGRVPGREFRKEAVGLGEWLLSIQMDSGAWQGGLYPARGEAKPSIFNTGQILAGMAALYDATGEARWLEGAGRGADWLAAGVNQKGHWSRQDYRCAVTPSYYNHVAWPMLEVWRQTQNGALRGAAERVLRFVLWRRKKDGSFDGWAFSESLPAFTHTIAYTLRGLQESARLLDNWETYGTPAIQALELLARRAELASGALAGAYAEGWEAVKGYSCLTGNAQIALCLLVWEEREKDLRIVNAAAKLVDFVCAKQKLGALSAGVRGAVAGSAPLWGGYMRMRYPNWAAKYHCDALMMLMDRLRKEMETQLCASS